VKHIATSLIRLYQLVLSPVLPSTCIYHPSCSQYALEAIDKHGFWHGTGLALRRLVRCGPWRAGGTDPVP
jgi:putative membrane protein insertion efficiency factor